MAKEEITGISKSESSGFTLPKGAKIIKKETRINTKKIMNGYITSKNYDIEYELNSENKYKYYTEEWYTKTDPLTFNDKALADKF